MLIPKNTTIPTKKAETFTTAADDQPSVEVQVFQGERPMAEDNKKIGQFHLDGIPPAPRGTPQIEVGFDLDANGVLSVSAKNLGTQKQQTIRIEASSGMSKDEVGRMKRDAEVHADDEDKRRREYAEAKNVAETRIHTIEKTLAGAGPAVSAADRAPIDRATAKVREALGGRQTLRR